MTLSRSLHGEPGAVPPQSALGPRLARQPEWRRRAVAPRTGAMAFAVALSISMSRLAGAAGPASDPGIAALEERKTALQARQRDIENRVRQSDALAPLRKTIEAAQEESDRTRRTGAMLMARMAELSASRELDQLFAARAGAGGRTAKVGEQSQALAAQWQALKFRTGLTALKLQCETRKALLDADEDAEVKRLAEAVSAAEKNLRDNPSAEVAAARAALSKASAALAAMDRKLEANARLQVLAAAERTARQTVREAELKDPRREAIEKARLACEQARAEALARIPEAAPFRAAIEAAEMVKTVVETKRRGMRRILDAHREAVRAGSDSDVGSARQSLAVARQSYDRLLASTPALSNLTAQADALRKACDRKLEETLGKLPEYRELTAGIAEQEAKAAELEARATRAVAGDELAELALEIERIRAELGRLSAHQRDVRLGAAKEMPDAPQQARAADRALELMLAELPAAADAMRNIREAEETLKKSVEKALAKGREPAAALRKLRELDRESIELEGRIAAQKYCIENERSAIRPLVESDETLAGRREQLRALEVEMRQNPSGESRVAQDALANAQIAYNEALAEAGEPGYHDADVLRRNAETALRKAERNDPGLKIVEEARAAWQRKREALAAEAPDVRKAREDHQKLEAELNGIQDRRRALIAQAAEEDRAALDRSDPDIAAARKKLEEARRDASRIANSGEMLAASRRVEDARAELERRVRELALADAEYLAVAREIADIETQLARVRHDLDGDGKGD